MQRCSCRLRVPHGYCHPSTTPVARPPTPRCIGDLRHSCPPIRRSSCPVAGLHHLPGTSGQPRPTGALGHFPCLPPACPRYPPAVRPPVGLPWAPAGCAFIVCPVPHATLRAGSIWKAELQERAGMNEERILAEIREANLSYLILAQSLIRTDRVQALYRLGLSEEVADLLDQLSPAQMMRMAQGNMLLCRLPLRRCPAVAAAGRPW